MKIVRTALKKGRRQTTKHKQKGRAKALPFIIRKGCAIPKECGLHQGQPVQRGRLGVGVACGSGEATSLIVGVVQADDRVLIQLIGTRD